MTGCYPPTLTGDPFTESQIPPSSFNYPTEILRYYNNKIQVYMDIQYMSTEQLREYFKEEEIRILEKICSFHSNLSYESTLLFLEPLKKIHEEIKRRELELVSTAN